MLREEREDGLQERHGGEKGRSGEQCPGLPLQAGARPAPGLPGSPLASLTTLSSGTERLRVHSWLFTKESAGEKAACQDGNGVHTCAICHQLSPTLRLPRPRPEDIAIQMRPQPSPFCPSGAAGKWNGVMTALKERTEGRGHGPLHLGPSSSCCSSK